MDFKNVKNILFDFGGVIVSLKLQNALNRFKEIGFENIEDYLTEFRQKDIFLDYETGHIDRENFQKEFQRLGNNQATMEEIDSAWLAFLTGIPEYKYQLLKDLRKKYKLYMLSNTNPSVMGWAMSDKFSPDGQSVDQFFDQCFLSYQMGTAKPDKKIFEMIISSGIKPEETLFLDDGQKNIDAAKEFGFQVHLTDQDEDLTKLFEQVE